MTLALPLRVLPLSDNCSVAAAQLLVAEALRRLLSQGIIQSSWNVAGANVMAGAGYQFPSNYSSYHRRRLCVVSLAGHPRSQRPTRRRLLHASVVSAGFGSLMSQPLPATVGDLISLSGTAHPSQHSRHHESRGSSAKESAKEREDGPGESCKEKFRAAVWYWMDFHVVI